MEASTGAAVASNEGASAGASDPANWLHGVQYLTKDATGYVYWRGRHVEHFSYPRDDPESEARAARDLARRCVLLEKAGLPVTLDTTVSAESYLRMASMQPNGKAWTLAMLGAAVYTFAEHPQGAAVMHFWVAPSNSQSSDDLLLCSWHFPGPPGKMGQGEADEVRPQPQLVLGDFSNPMADMGMTNYYRFYDDGYEGLAGADAGVRRIESLNARGVGPQDLIAVAQQARQAYDEHREQQQRSALAPRCAP